MKRVAAMLPVLATACGGAEPPANLSRNQVAEQLARLRVEPGLWERSSAVVDVSAQGAPRELVKRMVRPRSSTRHCITPEQAQRPDANFMAGREGAQCESRSFRMEGGRMSGDMLCVDPRSGGRWNARMQGQYTTTSYDLELIMEMPNPWDPGQMLVTSRTQGRRLGPCEGPATHQKGKQQ
jgi:hypothetical protein